MKQQNQSISQTLITGVYRTGSEFLSKLLSRHPKLSSTDYRINLLRFIYNRYNPISEKDNLQKCLHDLSDRLQERYDISIDMAYLTNELEQHKPLDYGVLYDVLMSYLYLHGEIEHWAEKNQLVWREVSEFLNIMPNGKAIIIIRDPRSVLVSFKNYTYAEPPAYLGAIFNCYDCMKAVKNYVSQYSNDQFAYVRYEDLASKPLAEVNRLFKMIGLNELEVLTELQSKDAYGNEWNANSSFHPNKEMRDHDVQDSISRWKGRIEPDELALTEAVCGELMDYFGYERALDRIGLPTTLNLFDHDRIISKYFDLWKNRGIGIQSFPTDPTDPKNWEENQS